jgi:hypothetical protein
MAGAQTNQDTGPLQKPKPYGDRGTTGPLGNPPIAYPGPNPGQADPVRYWKNRIIANPGYGGGGTVIIINGTPCYAPMYYGNPGYYDDSAVSMDFNVGGMRMGFSQARGGYLNGGQEPTLGNGWQFNNGVMTRVREPSAAELRQVARRNASAGSRTDDGDYYLNAKPKPKGPLDRDSALAEAVADIQTAFRINDIVRLEKHIDTAGTIVLQNKGRTRQSIPAATYVEMTRDALKAMKTTTYVLDKVEPASNGAWMVYGTHILKTEDGAQKKFNVGFVLKKSGDRWVIAEVGADPAQ